MSPKYRMYVPTECILSNDAAVMPQSRRNFTKHCARNTRGSSPKRRFRICVTGGARLGALEGINEVSRVLFHRSLA